MTKALINGGGIAGLSTAWALARRQGYSGGGMFVACRSLTMAHLDCPIDHRGVSIASHSHG